MGSASPPQKHSKSVDEKCQEKCRKEHLALGSSLGIDVTKGFDHNDANKPLKPGVLDMDGNMHEQMHDGDKELWEHPEEDPEWKKGGRCRTNMCADGCYAEDSHEFRGPKKYLPCQEAYQNFAQSGSHASALDQRTFDPRYCDSFMSNKQVIRDLIQSCPDCIDGGNTFKQSTIEALRFGKLMDSDLDACQLTPENAEAAKKQRVNEWNQHCDDQHAQCLKDPPALGSSLGVDGVHATSFTLGALVAFTLGAVAYFVRRPRGTQMTDSRRAYGATTVQ